MAQSRNMQLRENGSGQKPSIAALSEQGNKRDLGDHGMLQTEMRDCNSCVL